MSKSKKNRKKHEKKIKNKNFFKVTKRKIIVFIILFYFLFFYLPVIKCIPDHDVKEDFCETYGLCKVDVYSSASTMLSEYDSETNSFLCPATRINILMMLLLTLAFIIGTYLITCVLDFYYAKFRDK